MKRPCERYGCPNPVGGINTSYCGTPECESLRAAAASRQRSSRTIRVEREVESIPSRVEQLAQAASDRAPRPPQRVDCAPVMVPGLPGWTPPRPPALALVPPISPVPAVPDPTNPQPPEGRAPNEKPAMPQTEDLQTALMKWAQSQTSPWRAGEAADGAHLSSEDAGPALRTLVQAGRLVRTGAGPATRYHLPGQVAARAPTAGVRAAAPAQSKAGRPPALLPADLSRMSDADLLAAPGRLNQALEDFKARVEGEHARVKAELASRLASRRAELATLEAAAGLAPQTKQEAA